MCMKSRCPLLLCVVLTTLFSCADSTTVDNSTVKAFDLHRFLGSWYELARYDHRFERGLSHCTAHYALKSDGTIEVRNQGRREGKIHESLGKAKTTAILGLLRVSFWGPFYSDYRVLMLASDYSYALVGSGSAKYLWILSRTPQLPKKTLSAILHEATRRGYDTSKLIWVNHGVNLASIGPHAVPR